MDRPFTNIFFTIAAAAVVAAGSYAFANVPDDDFLITDKDEATTQAFLDLDNAEFEIDVEASCLANTFLEVFSTHPDEVKLKKNKGEAGQTQKDNQAEFIIATVRLSIDPNRAEEDADNIANRVTCEKLEVEADVKTKNGKGSFEASGKNCVCDDTFTQLELDALFFRDGFFDLGEDVDLVIADGCTSYPVQITAAAVDCDGRRSVTLRFSDRQIQGFKIKGKGDADIVDVDF